MVTPLRIYHWGYADRRQRRTKAQRNLTYLLADLQDRPDDFYLHYHLARHYFFAGKPEEALGHLEWVLAAPNLAGQNPEIARHAPLMTAQVWDRLGDPAEARRQLAALLEQYPDYGLAWFHLGLSHFRDGEAAPAAAALARFLELGSGHFFLDQPEEKLSLTAMLTLAQALRQLARLEEAGAVLRQAQQQYPRQPGVWLETAAWAEACRDRTGARRALETCLTLRPDSRRAQVLLRGMEGTA
jgi:predicted Zn-dependent protease